MSVAALLAAAISNSNSFAQAGRQEAAIFIRDSGSIILDTSHPSGISDPDSTARANIVDTAACDTAETSNYADPGETEVWLHSGMLSAMRTLVTSYGYTYRVSEIAGGDHSSTSYHYRGTAFDVYIINGVGVSSGNPYWSTFNQRCGNMGAIERLGPGNAGHSTHVHNAWPSGTSSSSPGGCIQNNAAAGARSHPATVTTGQSFSATITMNNNGGTHWVNSNGYNLGSQNPQDNTRWGMGRVGFAGTISPGQNCSFTFNCTAPTTAGSYAFDWKMVQDGVEWFGATSGGGIQVNAPSTGVIVDNTAATYTGSWATGTSAADKYGADYRYHSTAPASEPATFTANITGGAKNIYAWWPQGSNRSTTAPYVVTHAGGSTTVNKNQQANGGSWQLLGNWNFNAGNNNVKLSCWTATGFIVVADAVKFGD